jgi:hypothetical protein
MAEVREMRAQTRDQVFSAINVIESELVSDVVCDEHLKQLEKAHPDVDFKPTPLYPNE